MHLGVCRVTLRLPENNSLKGKRRLFHSLSSRLRQRFNVSVAEVGDNELWQLATIGICCVSNSSRHVDEMLEKVLAHVENRVEELEVIDIERETIRF